MDCDPYDAFLDIAVLCGGDSAEREISLKSGAAVASALREQGHFVSLFDPAQVELFSINWRQFDACFIALHGGDGEGGQVQKHLEELGVPYTGSCPVAARLAMSKSATKDRFHQFGIPNPRGRSIRPSAPINEIYPHLGPLRYPMVIKPDSQGSSLGVSIVRTPDDLPQAVEDARQFESFLLAESFVSGREVTVAVLEREPLSPIEIIHGRELFDFETKYRENSFEFRFLEDDDPVAEAAASTAVEATGVLGTRGLVRVDMIVDETGQPWVLEVNTIPGMTELSLAPRAAARSGIPMPELCEQMVRFAIESEVVI